MSLRRSVDCRAFEPVPCVFPLTHPTLSVVLLVMVRADSLYFPVKSACLVCIPHWLLLSPKVMSALHWATYVHCVAVHVFYASITAGALEPQPATEGANDGPVCFKPWGLSASRR